MDKEISYSGFVRSDDTEPKKNPTRNYDYWARQLSHGDTLDSIRRGLEYKEIADNLREYLD